MLKITQAQWQSILLSVRGAVEAVLEEEGMSFQKYERLAEKVTDKLPGYLNPDEFEIFTISME